MHFSKEFTEESEHFVIVLNRLFVFINFIPITNQAKDGFKTPHTKLSNVFIIVYTTHQCLSERKAIVAVQSIYCFNQIINQPFVQT